GIVGSLIAQGTRYALGLLRIALQGRAGLLAAHRCLTGLLVGFVDLRGLLAAREVYFCCYLGADVASTDQGIQQGQNALDGAVFNVVYKVALLIISTHLASGRRQQAAVLVND